MKILLVDSDLASVKTLKFSLEKDENEVVIMNSGVDTLRLLSKEEFDFIILELNLQDIDGLDLCQKIRERYSIPMIILTSKNEDMVKILGLEYGADDFITKPYNILELRARMKAIMRRIKTGGNTNNERTVKIEDIEINTLGRKVYINDKNVSLTAKEFDLLVLLATNPGKIYSREELLGSIWGYEYFGDLRTVDVHIRRLREKIEKEGNNYEYILTKWGLGYYFRNCVNS